MELNKLFYISEKTWYILQAWATLAYDEDKNEISGLLTAIPGKDGRYELDNAEILKQKNTGTNTTLDADSVSAYKMKYAMEYKNKNMKYVWWHSHHTMKAFWSGTDENEINEWKNESFSLALVINLKEEYKFRVSVWKASGLDIEQHYDIPLTIERGSKIKIDDKMKTLYKELCEDDGYTYAGNNHNVRQQTLNYNRGFTRQIPHINPDMASSYSQTVEKIDTVNDAFMDSSINLNQYTSELKKINVILKSKQLPFKIDIPKGNKAQVIDKIMVLTSGEMLNFDNEQLKMSLEDDYVFGGHYYGY